YPERLCERFKLGERDPLSGFDTNMELLEFIGSKRGCLRAGGIVDTHQAATIVLHELRSGKLGPICLESPEMMQAEMAIFLAELEAKRALENPQADTDQGRSSEAS